MTSFYVMLSGVLFAIGALGVMTRRNTIVMFMCVEIMLNAVNISLVAFAREFGDVNGQVYVFFVMAIAAAEAAVGLAIILSVFRNFNSIRVSDVQDLHG